MPMRTFETLVLALLASLALACTATAAPAAPPLKVGVVLSPSFVEKPNAAPAAGEKPYDGFAVDLWRAVAVRTGHSSEFIEFPTFDAAVAAAAEGKVDIAISDISATGERAKRVDFSYPIADGGLRVMVTTDPKHSLARLWHGLVERGHIEILAYGSLIVVLASVVLMLVWRRLDREFPAAPHEGFAESLYRTVSITVSGKTKVVSSSNWITKILAAIWLACGVAIMAYITSSITTVMTVQATSGGANSVDDLKDKPVGALAGSIGESYCWRAGFATHSFPSVEEAVSALVARKVAGVVGDGPVLQAYDHKHPELPITEVGPLFEKHKYAFALPRGSALRSDVDAALISLDENGDTAKLAAKYFGGN